MMQDIDFVITWVDGSDPNWLAEKKKYQSNKETEDDTEVRYRDWDNLQYWFRAVEKYAPWVRKIHFVTWGHVPEWLNVDHPKLNIVKHTDFIPEKYLPTFNSHTIELNLHRIEDLAERFVYFNDDVFLNAPVKSTQFFKDGLPVDVFELDVIAFSKDSAGHYQGNDVSLINDNFKRSAVTKKHFNKVFASSYGLKLCCKNAMLSYRQWFPGFGYMHTSYNYLKSSFVEVWEKETETMDQTCSCRFRNVTNVNQWVIRYWQLASGNFVPGKKKYFGRSFQLGETVDLAVKAIEESKFYLVCINDTSKTQNFEQIKERINQAFEKKMPVKSSFEK